MENCPCPEEEVIPSVPDVICPENLGQVVRLILTLQGNELAANVAAAKLLATWTALLSASDATKIQITPKLMEAVTIPIGEPITEGGDDNSTPLGRQIVVGASTIIVEGFLRNVDSLVIKALKQFRCVDQGGTGLDIAMVNEFGEIAMWKNDDDTLRGFHAHAWFVGDKGAEGKNTQDKSKIRWGFDEGWRDQMVLVKPTDFDPRFDLVNPGGSI